AIENTADRIKALVAGKDKAGQFLRDTLVPTLEYTAKVAPDLAYSIDDVDRAMQWGFGWELGPFEIMDAIGLRAREHRLSPAAPDLQILKSAKEREKVVRKNAGASLVDLGDGVLAVEFHS